jgi:carboxyl-terminal processing protease
MKKRFKKRYVVLSAVVMIGLWSFISPQNDKYFEIIKNLDIFATLYKEVNAQYVDEINPNTLIKVGADAMLGSLDPYTRFYPEDQIEDARTERTGQYGGIGAIVGDRNNKVTVIMPNKGFAADRAGLKRGDEIIGIQEIDVKGDYEKASQFLRGQSSKKVKIKVDRVNVGILDLEVELEQIELPNVPYFGMLNDEIGIVKLTGFTQSASREVESALKALKKEGATKFVLDVRGNPGGLLGEAVNITNLFIPKGELVVTTKGKVEEMNATYNTLNNPFDLEVPLVVLTSNSSASASEIVAGTIQDYDRGVVIGQRSYGKGLVQRTLPLSYNSQMKVTIAKYYTPSGRCIQALDYGNRNADGSVGKFADSLMTAFKTTNGRLVYDGGGVNPDFVIETKKLAPVTINLLAQDLFFDFGNEYEATLGEISAIADFEISDQIFNDFLKWLEEKEYDYTTPLERELERLKLTAEQSGELISVQSELDALENKLDQGKNDNLHSYKKEIKYFLLEEFITRQFLEVGQIEVSYLNDEDINKAIEILSDLSSYRSTLAGQ